MNRTQITLLLILFAELIGAGVLLYRRWQQPAVPPLATAGVNAFDLEELRAAHERARRGGRAEARALGLAYFAQGMMADAEVCYRAAADGAQDPELVYDWAFCLGQSGQADAAVTQFLRAIELGHPDPSRCWYFIGLNELRQEHAEDAKAAFRQAEPLPAATYELAKALIKEGNLARALEMLPPLARIHPTAYQPHYLLSRAYQLKGDKARAALHADRWLRLAGEFRTPFDDEHARVSQRAHEFAFIAQRRQCFELVKARQFDTASGLIERLLKANPTADLADLRADIAVQRGRPDEALQWLRRAVELDGPSMHALWRLADAHAEVGQVDEARRLWDVAIRLGEGHPELEVLCTQVSVHYQRRGEPEKHLQYQVQALRAAGISRVWRGEYAEAIEPLEVALQRGGDDALTWYFLGEARRYHSQVEPAREAYFRCLTLEPYHGRALRAAAVLGEG